MVGVGHLGANGRFYWDYPEHGQNRIERTFFHFYPYVMTFYGSTTQNKRVFSLNGVEITGTPSADTLTGAFSRLVSPALIPPQHLVRCL